MTKHENQDKNELDSSKVSGSISLPKSISRKPKLRQKENENTSNTSSNSSKSRTFISAGPRKSSTTGNDILKIYIPLSLLSNYKILISQIMLSRVFLI